MRTYAPIEFIKTMPKAIRMVLVNIHFPQGVFPGGQSPGALRLFTPAIGRPLFRPNFGILYPNNCSSFRRLNHSALLLILLHLLCPCISFTLNSKLFSLNNPLLLSLLHQLLSVLWPLDLDNGFHLTIMFQSVAHFHLVHLRQCL